MGCWTSEEYLKNLQNYARKSGWKYIPEYKHVDAECPYCGVDLTFEYDYEGAYETEEECPSCGETFDLLIEWEPTYTCSKRRSTDGD